MVSKEIVPVQAGEMEPLGGEVRTAGEAGLAALAQSLVETARTQGVQLTGPGGLLTGLTRQVLETALQVEMADHLGYERGERAGHGSGNSRNGTSAKTLRTDIGEVRIEVPRDRAGTFAPAVIPKHSRRLAGFDQAVLSLYAKGMTTGDIAAHLADTYGAEVSRELVSKVTDAVVADMNSWQSRPLDAVYPVILIDAIVIKIREGQVANRPVYVAMGISIDGHRDVLGMWAGPSGTPLPATAQTLAEYTVRLIGISLSPATIDQVIGTIRSRHRSAGFANQPDTTETLKLVRAYKREWADEGGRTRKATPILIEALRDMVDTCAANRPQGIRDRAILLLGFNGMCRRSELSKFDIDDMADAGDEGLFAYVSRSKTDQAAKGAEVSIPFGQHTETCAVRAVRAWISEMQAHGITTGALFRPVDRYNNIAGQAKYAGKVSSRLTGKSVSDVVRRRALLANIPNPAGYTGHSLRSGAATSAYLAGAPVAEIAAHGRWSATSPVVLGYIRAVAKWRHNPMKGIGL